MLLVSMIQRVEEDFSENLGIHMRYSTTHKNSHLDARYASPHFFRRSYLWLHPEDKQCQLHWSGFKKHLGYDSSCPMLLKCDLNSNLHLV